MDYGPNKLQKLRKIDKRIKRIRRFKTNWFSYEEITDWVHRFQFSNYKKWTIFTKKYKLPYGIPYSPRQVYKDKYISDMDFLGHPLYISYKKLRTISRGAILSSKKHWLEWRHNNRETYGEKIPRFPETFYDEWTSWEDFLDLPEKVIYTTFDEAIKNAHSLNIRTFEQWYELVHKNMIPEDIPKRPDNFYKEQWKDWPYFLGKKIEDKIKVLQQVKTDIIYVIKEIDTPYNVLTIGIEPAGKTKILQRQKIEQFQIYALYSFDSNNIQYYQYCIQRNASEYWDGENMYLVTSLPGILFDLEQEFKKI